MDIEIYKDNLRNNEKLNDEIIQQFIRLKKECDENNKEYAELQKDHKVLTEKLRTATERLGQLMDEHKLMEKACRHPKAQSQPPLCVWVNFFFSLLLVLSLLLIHGILNKDNKEDKDAKVNELDFII